MTRYSAPHDQRDQTDQINGVPWRHAVWSGDSWKPFTTVNGMKASGGAYDAHGPMVAGDQVIVSSGYDSFGQKAGNLLLVYQLEGGTVP